MSWWNAHYVWLGTVLSGLIMFAIPSMNAYLANNPHVSVLVVTLWGVACAWAKSPKS